MYISTHLYIYGTQWDEARRQICNHRQAIAHDSPSCRTEETLLFPLSTPYQCNVAIVTGRERNNGAEAAGVQERAHYNELLRGNRPYSHQGTPEKPKAVAQG